MRDEKVPPAQPHGELREVFPGVFFVTETVGLPGRTPGARRTPPCPPTAIS